MIDMILLGLTFTTGFYCGKTYKTYPATRDAFVAWFKKATKSD